MPEFLPPLEGQNEPSSGAATLIPFLSSDGVTFEYQTGFSYDKASDIMEIPSGGQLGIGGTPDTGVALHVKNPDNDTTFTGIIVETTHASAHTTFSLKNANNANYWTYGIHAGDSTGIRYAYNTTGAVTSQKFSLYPAKAVFNVADVQFDQKQSHVGDADTYRELTTDQISDFAGGVEFIRMVEAGTDVLNLGNLATITTKICSSLGTLALFGASGSTRPAAYTQTFATATRVMSAYTADDESTSYNFGAGECNIADLNALRVAVENLRAFAENIAGVVNQHTDDWQAFGAFQ